MVAWHELRTRFQGAVLLQTSATVFAAHVHKSVNQSPIGSVRLYQLITRSTKDNPS